MKKLKKGIVVTRLDALHALRRLQNEAERHNGWREGADYDEAIGSVRRDARRVRAWVNRP